MPIKMQCPGCGEPLTFPDQAEGRRAKCASCQVVMVVTKPKAIAPTSESPTNSAPTDGGLMLSMLEEDRAARQKRTASGTDDDLPPGMDTAEGGVPDAKRMAALTVMAGGDPSLANALKQRGKVRRYTGASTAAGELAEMLVGLISIILSIIGFTYVTFAMLRASKEGSAWLALTLSGSMLVLFLILVVPGCLGAMKVASMAMRFELPESPYYRTLVAVCFPFAMSTLGSNFSQAYGILFGFGGIALTYFVLWLMFRLRPLEWLVGAILATVAFVPLMIATMLGSVLITTWAASAVAKVDRDIAAAKERGEQKPAPVAPAAPSGPARLIDAALAMMPIPADSPEFVADRAVTDQLDPEITAGNLSIRTPPKAHVSVGDRGVQVTLSLKELGKTYESRAGAMQNAGQVQIVVQKAPVALQQRPIVGFPQVKSDTKAISGGFMMQTYEEYEGGLFGIPPCDQEVTSTAVDQVRLNGHAATRTRCLLSGRSREITQFVMFDGDQLMHITVNTPVDRPDLTAQGLACAASVRKVDPAVAGWGEFGDRATALRFIERGYGNHDSIKFKDTDRDEVLALAKSPKPKLRAAAMWWLTQWINDETLGIIKAGLNDEAPEVRYAALRVSEKFSSEKPDAITKFLIQMQSLDAYDVELYPTIVLICSEAVRVIPSLSHWSVRDNQASPANEPRREQVRQAILDRLKVGAPAEFPALALALGRWGNSNDIAMLREHYQKPDIDEPTKLVLMVSLARLKDPSMRDLWLERLRNNKPEWLYEALTPYGSSIERDVLAALRASLDADVTTREGLVMREAMISILGDIGTRQSLPILNELAERRRDEPARKAADAIRARIRGEKDKATESQPASPAPATP